MFMKKLNKVASVLSTAVLLAGLATPIAASAATFEVTGVQAVNASATSTDYKDLGEVKVDAPISDLKDGDFFLLRLPSDFKLNIPDAVTSTTDIAGAVITKPDGSTEPFVQAVGGKDPWSDGATNHLAIYQTNANELKVVVTHAAKAQQAGSDADTVLKINLGSVYVPGNAPDTIKAIIEAQPGGAFSNDSVTLATKGSGTVSVSIDSAKTIPQSGAGALDTIRFKEDSPGALRPGTSLKLRLPNGFNWANSSYPISFVYGDANVTQNMTATRAADPTELDVNVLAATNAATYFTINNAAIEVQDTTVAKYGDIALDVNGLDKTDVSSLIVGKYAQYVTTVSIGNPKNVLAGRAGIEDPDHTEIGQLILQESAPGSLRAGGTIQVQLTGGAKWALDKNGHLTQTPQLDTSLSDLQGLALDDSVGDHGWKLVGNNGDTIMATIKTASNGTNGGKIVLDKGLVDLAADAAAGDIHAVVSGTAGASGDAGVIAKIVPPASITVADSTPKHVQAGVQNQVLSDITVKENAAGAIDATGTNPSVRFTFQPGVRPNLPDPSQIKVTGDLMLDTSSMRTDVDTQGRGYIDIPVKSASTTPSTITLVGEQVTVDRSAPEGNLMVYLNGSMVQTAGTGTNDFPSSTNVADAAAANVIIPSNGSVMNSASFVIGSVSYTVNGQTKTMDVAPFIDENGRTQLPVRAVGEALGAIVGWDPQDQTVSILKDGKAISITVGSYVMNVGGVFVQNDSPAVMKDGRVFLPFRVIAEAVGAQVQWDAQSGTAYLN